MGRQPLAIENYMTLMLTIYHGFLASCSIIAMPGSIMLILIGPALRTDISRFAPGWIFTTLVQVVIALRTEMIGRCVPL